MFDQPRLQLGPGVGIYLGKQELLSEKRSLRSTCSWHHSQELQELSSVLQAASSSPRRGGRLSPSPRHFVGPGPPPSPASSLPPTTTTTTTTTAAMPSSSVGEEAAAAPGSLGGRSTPGSLLFGSFNPDVSVMSGMSSQ